MRFFFSHLIRLLALTDKTVCVMHNMNRYQIYGACAHMHTKCSITSGSVPREWERAKVVPIYESGRKEEPLN